MTSCGGDEKISNYKIEMLSTGLYVFSGRGSDCEQFTSMKELVDNCAKNNLLPFNILKRITPFSVWGTKLQGMVRYRTQKSKIALVEIFLVKKFTLAEIFSTKEVFDEVDFREKISVPKVTPVNLYFSEVGDKSAVAQLRAVM